MFGGCLSKLLSGCLVVLVILAGLIIYSVKSDKFDLFDFIRDDSRPSLEITDEVKDTAYAKLEVIASELENSKEAILQLTSEEATFLISDYISDNNNLLKFENVNVAFKPGYAVIYSDGIFNIGTKFNIIQKEQEDIADLKVTSTYIGKIKAPMVLSDYLSNGITLVIEQLKTENFGNVKLKKIKFLDNSAIIVLERV